MHTRCPSCHTTFTVTASQLDARQGLVRCGRCAAVFQAEKHAVDTRSARQRKRQSKTGERAITSKRSAAKANAKRERRGAKKTTAPPTAVAAKPPRDEVTAAEFVTPALAKILLASRSSHLRRGLWASAILVLVALLAVQVVFFYASELARSPKLRPWIVAACEPLGCVIRPRQDIRKIQLLHSSIAPHPEQRAALRIRSSLVNRADFDQPYPLMEVTLTSRNGEIVARRAYLPHEYLAPAYWSARMTPNVVVNGILDINHPTPAPVGYEIRLVAAP